MIVLLGNGGHAKVVRSVSFQKSGSDLDPVCLSAENLKGVKEILQTRPFCVLHIAIGENKIRARLAQEYHFL